MSPCAPSPASKTSAPTAVRGVLEREPGAGGEGSFKSPWAAPEEGEGGGGAVSEAPISYPIIVLAPKGVLA